MKVSQRKVPPYMTKTGVQIGLLHQEPFHVRMDEDTYLLQKALLAKKHKTVKKEYLTIDAVIYAVCIVLLLTFAIGGYYGLL